jgi:hypothetical protein
MFKDQPTDGGKDGGVLCVYGDDIHVYCDHVLDQGLQDGCSNNLDRIGDVCPRSVVCGWSGGRHKVSKDNLNYL